MEILREKAGWTVWSRWEQSSGTKACGSSSSSATLWGRARQNSIHKARSWKHTLQKYSTSTAWIIKNTFYEEYYQFFFSVRHKANPKSSIYLIIYRLILTFISWSCTFKIGLLDSLPSWRKELSIKARLKLLIRNSREHADRSCRAYTLCSVSYQNIWTWAVFLTKENIGINKWGQRAVRFRDTCPNSPITLIIITVIPHVRTYKVKDSPLQWIGEEPLPKGFVPN